MKKFWCVTSSYYNDGSVHAAITDSKMAADKPTDSFHSGARCDVYNDWFDNYDEAKKFVGEMQRDVSSDLGV